VTGNDNIALFVDSSDIANTQSTGTSDDVAVPEETTRPAPLRLPNGNLIDAKNTLQPDIPLSVQGEAADMEGSHHLASDPSVRPTAPTNIASSEPSDGQKRRRRTQKRWIQWGLLVALALLLVAALVRTICGNVGCSLGNSPRTTPIANDRQQSSHKSVQSCNPNHISRLFITIGLSADFLIVIFLSD
jgi:hypothetical protein